MNRRLYPINISYFNKAIKPLIKLYYSKSGTPSKIDDYTVFCAMLYVLRTGISWRDLPSEYGNWNVVYQRFKRSSDRGVWWNVIYTLQRDKLITINMVSIDSSSVKYHRHGGGLKGGSSQKGAQ